MVARSWTLPSDLWPGLGHWADGSLVMAERADEVLLAQSEHARGDSWHRGHCFTAGWHLQWRRLGASVRAVALGPVPLLSEEPFSSEEPSEKQSLSDWKSEKRSVVLWGKRQPGEAMWLELRIPNVMEPPIQHPASHEAPTRGEDDPPEETLLRRVLHLITYRKPGGESAFHRYVGLGYARSDEEETTFDVFGHPATA